ncbi:MAG: helix-turn-helix domain-containing protein [Ktedonobacterales bacterium]|nr:helix-turn-helix domain-containing protein [Ktedonobacterales bacterium]
MNDAHRALITTTLQQFAARLVALARRVSRSRINGHDFPPPDERTQGTLEQALAVIAAAAEGAPVERNIVAAAVQHAMETLFAPLAGDNFAIPDGFYATPLGELIAAAQRRLYDAGDYLTTAAAARRLGMHRNSVYALMEQSKLRYIIVDGERKPLREAVEALAEHRR